MSKKSADAAALFHRVIPLLKMEYRKWRVPIVTAIAERRDPFQVLISTLLSLRTQDETTATATHRLFRLARSPKTMAKLPAKRIIRAIYPVGFYRTKARVIIDICNRLVSEFGGRVPSSLDTLLTFKGVGRKTANLVLTRGFGLPGICVDTHVHRISNRLGAVKTRNPEETEFALRKVLPERYWIIYNDLLVAFGQNLCRPISPKCSECRISRFCPKIGVLQSR
jgi:endonuclease III